MDLKLTIYEDKFCKKQIETLVISDFGLSTEICEEIIKLVNPESFASLKTLSKESQIEIIVEVVKEAYPYLKDLIKEMFEIQDNVYFKFDEFVMVIVAIYTYAMGQLKSAVGKFLPQKN